MNKTNADSGRTQAAHGHNRLDCALCISSCTHSDELTYGACKLTDHEPTVRNSLTDRDNWDSMREAVRCLKFLALGINWTLREADLAVVKHMIVSTTTVEEAERIAADYVWDHLLGEPDFVSVQQLLDTYHNAREIFKS